MSDREQAIKEFAEKHKLSEAEAGLVYGTGNEDEIMLNFALLQEIKGGKVRNDDEVRESDLQKQAQDLIQKADEMMRAGNTAGSISLRRQAYGIQTKK